jgi:hypothetical protein
MKSFSVFFIVISILLTSLQCFAEDAITIVIKGKPLHSVINDLTSEHQIEFTMFSALGSEMIEVEMTDNLENLIARLLKGYNHVIGYDREGRIKSLKVISAKHNDSTFDVSTLPTGDLMPEMAETSEDN